METGWQSHNQWGSNDNHSHDVEISLNLSIDDILKGFKGNMLNVPETLEQNVDEIYKNVFSVIAEDFVPQMVSESIVNDDDDNNDNYEQDEERPSPLEIIEEKPIPKTKWDGELNGRNIDIMENSDGGLSIQKQMNMAFSLTTDEAVPTLEALYHARMGVADLVASTIVGNLSSIYLGKKTTERATETSFENGKVVDLESHEIGEV